jgi:hypothetical protein
MAPIQQLVLATLFTSVSRALQFTVTIFSDGGCQSNLTNFGFQFDDNGGQFEYGPFDELNGGFFQSAIYTGGDTAQQAAMCQQGFSCFDADAELFQTNTICSSGNGFHLDKFLITI